MPEKFNRVVCTIRPGEDFFRGELWSEDELWGEVYFANGEWRFVSWPRPNGKTLDLPLERVREFISRSHLHAPLDDTQNQRSIARAGRSPTS